MVRVGWFRPAEVKSLASHECKAGKPAAEKFFRVAIAYLPATARCPRCEEPLTTTKTGTEPAAQYRRAFDHRTYPSQLLRYVDTIHAPLVAKPSMQGRGRRNHGRWLLIDARLVCDLQACLDGLMQRARVVIRSHRRAQPFVVQNRFPGGHSPTRTGTSGGRRWRSRRNR